MWRGRSWLLDRNWRLGRVWLRDTVWLLLRLLRLVKRALLCFVVVSHPNWAVVLGLGRV